MKKSLILLSGLVAANTAFAEPKAPVESRPAFSLRAEMFEPPASCEIVTEASSNGNVLRCEYRSGNRPILAKRIPDGLLKDATGMTFTARADSHRQLCVAVSARDDVRRYQFVSVDKHWRQIDIPFAAMQGASDASESPELSAGLIDRIAINDRSQSGGVLRIADWKFDRIPAD